MADVNRRIEKSDKKASKVSAKVDLLIEKVSNINSPLRLRYYQAKMQSLQNKLQKIQNKRMKLDAEQYINVIYDEGIEVNKNSVRSEMRDKYTRIMQIEKRFDYIAKEKKDILKEMNGLKNGDGLGEEEEVEDPLFADVNKKIDKRYGKNKVNNQNIEEEIVEDDMGDTLSPELEKLNARLAELENEREGLIDERTRLNSEREQMAIEYENSVDKVEEARKKELAVINPNIFQRAASFVKNRIEAIKMWNSNRRERRAKKINEMKENIVNTEPSDKSNNKRDGFRSEIKVDPIEVREKLDAIFNKELSQEQEVDITEEKGELDSWTIAKKNETNTDNKKEER